MDACKAAGVKHLIFSLLESVQDAIDVKCPHFDAKGEIEKYMFASGVPSTSVRLSFYMENLMSMMKPQKQYDGGYQLGNTEFSLNFLTKKTLNLHCVI